MEDNPKDYDKNFGQGSIPFNFFDLRFEYRFHSDMVLTFLTLEGFLFLGLKYPQVKLVGTRVQGEYSDKHLWLE